MDETLPRHLFTADQYQQMGQTGIFLEDNPVELIQGELVVVPRPTTAEWTGVVALTHLLHDRLRGEVGQDLMISVNNPFRLDAMSEPHVDFAIIHRWRDRTILPKPENILVVIELAEANVAYQRDVKFPLYAAAGIPESWLFDLIANRIERHSEPGPDGYKLIALAGRGESLPSTVLQTIVLSIDDVLPDE